MLFDHDLKRPGGFYNALEGRYTDDDKAQREALEKANHGATNAPRMDLVGWLNGQVRAGTGPEAITKLRDKYQYPGGYRSADRHNQSHERFAKSADFNRLHPGSLRRAAAERPRNDFDNAADERYVTPLTGTYERVRDARGSVRGDNRGDRHFAGGEPASIDAEFLLAVARAVIAMVNSRSYGQGRV